MAIQLKHQLQEIINSKSTIAALATVDKAGIPHVTYKGSFHINEKGQIVFWEVIETSVTNKNLTYSIWFDRTVAINFLSEKKESYLITAKVKKAIISGSEFKKAYQIVREHFGDIDLSTIWVLEPIDVRDETIQKRRVQEEEKHPLLCHVDRFID